MPNWCYNSVIFSGDKENLNALAEAIKDAVQKEMSEKKAQKIHSLDEVVDGYFFDIYHEVHSDKIKMLYESKWSPNIDDVAELCKEYKVSAEHEYKECAEQLYGNVYYDESGEYTEDAIPQEFLDLISYDADESGMYVYDGQYWESEDDLIEAEYPIWKEKNL